MNRPEAQAAADMPVAVDSWVKSRNLAVADMPAVAGDSSVMSYTPAWALGPAVVGRPGEDHSGARGRLADPARRQGDIRSKDSADHTHTAAGCSCDAFPLLITRLCSTSGSRTYRAAQYNMDGKRVGGRVCGRSELLCSMR